MPLFFFHQDQEPGVRGQPDRGPDGPLRAARRARHHVHHAQGNKGNHLQKSVSFPVRCGEKKRWRSKKGVTIESVEYRVSGLDVFVSCRRVTTRSNTRRSRRTSATFSGFGLTPAIEKQRRVPHTLTHSALTLTSCGVVALLCGVTEALPTVQR